MTDRLEPDDEPRPDAKTVVAPRPAPRDLPTNTHAPGAELPTDSATVTGLVSGAVPCEGQELSHAPTVSVVNQAVETPTTPEGETPHTAAQPPVSVPDLPATLPSHQSDPPLPPSPPGYEILRLIKPGGMGAVYEARQLSLNRIVALKVILAGAHASAGERDRFILEAESVAALAHPGVVQVHDYGTLNGQPYMALEYCAGGSLAEKLAGTPIPARDAAIVVEQLALAVVAAHQQGILHRDLKPANVLLTPDGTPKVADFGLAKLVGSDDGATATGVAMGTPPYMAPEQVRDAKSVGPPADVYGLGAVLYECLTGRPPFKGATIPDTLNQVLTQEPVAVRVLNPQVPVDLETVTLKCLEKDAARRYESASAFADDLRAFLDGRPVVARPVGLFGRAWRWRKRNPGLAAAVAAAMFALVVGSVASTGFGLWALDEAKRADGNAAKAIDEAKLKEGEATRAETGEAKAKTEAENARKSAVAAKEASRKAQRLLGLMSASEGVKLADEGQLSLGLLKMANALVVAPESPEAVAMSRDQWALHRQHSWGGYKLSLLLSHSQGISSVAFSSDGRRVLTGSWDSTARVWDAETGKPLSPILQHVDVVNSVAFSPDGRRVLTGSDDKTARVWDAETGKPLSPALKHENWVLSVAFTTDGRRVLTGSKDKTAQVWDAETGKRLLPPILPMGWVLSVAFSPDGRRVLTGSDDKTARVWDAETSKPCSPPIQHAGLVNSVAFSPDGRHVLTGSQDYTARVWEAETQKALSAPLQHAGLVNSVAFSPDGRRVLTGNQGDAARVWDAETGNPLSPPLQHAGRVHLVVFSPDGRRVLTGSSDKTARMWDAETGKPLSPPLQHTAIIRSMTFSPDGRRVLTGNSDSTARVWDAETSKPLSPPLQHAGDVNSVAYSSDGRFLLTGSDDKTARVWDAETGRPLSPPLQHAGLVYSVVFSPDGRGVLTGSSDGTARLWDAATGKPLSPPLRHTDVVRSVAFSPDGRCLLTGSNDSTARLWDAETGKPLSPLLRYAGWVISVTFSQNNKQIIVISLYSNNKDTCISNRAIAPDALPIADLVGLSQLWSGHRLDDTGTFDPLTREELARLWAELRPKYPAEFTVSPESVRRWREGEIRDCMKEGNLRAAEFHYWALVAELASGKAK